VGGGDGDVVAAEDVFGCLVDGGCGPCGDGVVDVWVGFGFVVRGLKFEVWGLGFGVWGLGLGLSWEKISNLSVNKASVAY